MRVGVFSDDIFNVYNRKEYSFPLEKLVDADDSKIKAIDTLIAGSLSNNFFDKNPQVRNVFIPFSGRNGFDENYIKENKILLYSTSVHSQYVAERALALCLALMGKIVEYDFSLKKGNWSKRNFKDRISWNSLFNKKVGIYGFGAIGKEIEKLISPFNCEIKILSRSYKDGYQNVRSLEDLVDFSDVLFVSVPLTEDTRGVIDEKILARMKEKILINVARGKIIQEEALYQALLEKSLMGYASDVWFNYPEKGKDYAMPSKFPLENERVVMTPHCGGFAEGVEILRYTDILDQIERKYSEVNN